MASDDVCGRELGRRELGLDGGDQGQRFTLAEALGELVLDGRELRLGCAYPLGSFVGHASRLRRPDLRLAHRGLGGAHGGGPALLVLSRLRLCGLSLLEGLGRGSQLLRRSGRAGQGRHRLLTDGTWSPRGERASQAVCHLRVAGLVDGGPSQGRGGARLHEQIVGPRCRFGCLDRTLEPPFEIGRGCSLCGLRQAVGFERPGGRIGERGVTIDQLLERPELLAVAELLVHQGELCVGGRTSCFGLCGHAARLIDAAPSLARRRQDGLDLIAGRQGSRDGLQRPDALLGRDPVGIGRDLCLAMPVDLRRGVVEGLQPSLRRSGADPRLLQPRPSLLHRRALTGEGFERRFLAVQPALRGGLRRIESFVAEHALQHLVALGGGGREELAEAILRQQDRSAEGREIHAQQPLDPSVDRPLALDGVQGRRVG